MSRTGISYRKLKTWHEKPGQQRMERLTIHRGGERSWVCPLELVTQNRLDGLWSEEFKRNGTVPNRGSEQRKRAELRMDSA